MASRTGWQRERFINHIRMTKFSTWAPTVNQSINMATFRPRRRPAHQPALQSGELLGGEKRLRQEAFQPTPARHHLAIGRGQLLQAEHGDAVLELRVLRQRLPDFLRQGVVPGTDNAGRGHR